jgi:hypothetical protein
MKELVMDEDDKDARIIKLKLEIEETKQRLLEALSFIKSAKNILDEDVYQNVYKT